MYLKTQKYDLKTYWAREKDSETSQNFYQLRRGNELKAYRN
jgi:hypothetical protein